MATVLFCPAMFNLAETTRMIEVARALHPQHRAVFLGYETDYVSLVVDAGFEYRAGTPAWSAAERRQALAFDQGRSWRNPFSRALVTARVTLERSTIRELRAAVVVTGSNLTSFLSARAEGVPLVYPVPFALTHPQVAQTASMGFVDGSGHLTGALDRVATAAFRWIYTSAPLAPRAFTTVARANGVPPLRTMASLLRADHNLLTVMPWELHGYRLPADFTRVGPIFAHLDAPLPEIVRTDRPLVYLGLGSSADRRLALAAATALGALDVDVIAPIGHYLSPDDVVPANVRVTPLLPAHRLGGVVDAAVLHGGQGTVQTACATGVPFVGMGLQPEQTWNVRQCVRRGNAVAVSPKAVSSTAFLAAVERVISDPDLRAAAEQVRREYAGEDGAAATARVVEGLLPA